MNHKYCMDTHPITIEQLFDVIFDNRKLSLSADVIANIEKCRRYLDDSLKAEKSI